MIKIADIKKFHGKFRPNTYDVFVEDLIKDKKNIKAQTEKAYADYIREDLSSWPKWADAKYIYRLLLTRARFIQISYYPLVTEAKEAEDKLKQIVRRLTHKAILQGRVKQRDYCERCLCSDRKLLIHHPEPCNPMNTETLCYACHTHWHRSKKNK